jgi:hypothetical protein
MLPGWTVATPWGRGVGKSHFLRGALYLSAAQWSGRERVNALKPMTGVRWVLMAPTFKQATDLHADALESDLTGDGEWAWLGAKINRTKWRITFPGGGWIQLFGAENAHASRGLRSDGIAVDECDDIDLDVFDSVISPWFSEPWSLKQRLVCGTPRRARHGLLYRTFRRATAPDLSDRAQRHFAHHATGYDTPDTVDRAYLDQMRAETPAATFAREYLCSFDAGEGLVYAQFDERLHVRDPDDGTVWSEVLVGADHGWEDPGVLLVIGIRGSGRDATAHVIHEVYAPRMGEDWWLARAREIVGWFPNAKWYPDPSRPDRIAAFRKVGARIADDIDNSIEDGVETVNTLLMPKTLTVGGAVVEHGENVVQTVGGSVHRFARLYVARTCKHTIREMGVYKRRRDPRNAEQFLDEIVDRDNHAMDALRYPLFARFRNERSRGRNDASAERRQ